MDAELVTRKPSQTDRRRVVVQITARGERLLRKLSLAHHTELEPAGPALVVSLASLLDHRLNPRASAKGVRNGG